MNMHRIGIFIFLIAPLLAEQIHEGYAGDNAYVVSGRGLSAGGLKSPVQAEASAAQLARASAQQNFIEACRGLMPAGGGCREPSSTLREVAGALKSAKLVHKQCERIAEQSPEFSCRIILRIEKKQLKKLCEKVREESSPSCGQ